MFISKNAAQAIVEEIGNEIHEHINMMNENGVIIASTNPDRIGQVHEGARRVITEKLPELYITEEMETVTTKKGINLPLLVRDQIVGVVGITGEKEQVQCYGNIVRRMTEIMVEDSISRDVRRYDRRMKYRFMEEWISKTGSSYNRDFVERGHRLGIDVEKSYRVMVLGIREYQQLSDTVEGQSFLDDMEKAVRHELEGQGILYLRKPPRQVCFLPKCSDQQMQRIASTLQKMIKKHFVYSVTVGFDSGKSDCCDIHKHFTEAEKA